MNCWPAEILIPCGADRRRWAEPVESIVFERMGRRVNSLQNK